jgi:deoxyribonuclease-4
MFTIGAHISASGGYAAMARTALSIGANTFQFFTRNPRGGAAKAIDDDDVAEFHRICGENGIGVILAHAPYTLNLCSDKPGIREFALNTFADDLSRMEKTPGNLYNFHPGSHVGQGAEAGVALIAGMLGRILAPGWQTTVLLETMSGKGSEVGRNFDELRAIIDSTDGGDRLGVCLDTCHVWDGGYDIVGDLDGVLERFDTVLGISRLKAIHLNDSLNVRDAHKDRHACIGKGKIGLDALARVINHPTLRDLPFYLETPNDLDGYRAEIALLKSLRN